MLVEVLVTEQQAVGADQIVVAEMPLLELQTLVVEVAAHQRQRMDITAVREL
jgi:hypothetical protein